MVQQKCIEIKEIMSFNVFRTKTWTELSSLKARPYLLPVTYDFAEIQPIVAGLVCFYFLLTKNIQYIRIPYTWIYLKRLTNTCISDSRQFYCVPS